MKIPSSKVIGQDYPSSLKEIDLKITNLANSSQNSAKKKILITGQVSSGKSTFINSILSYPLLSTKITESTNVITEISYGKEPKLHYHYKGNFDLRECKNFSKLSPAEKSKQIEKVTTFTDDSNSKTINETRVFIKWPCPLLKVYS